MPCKNCNCSACESLKPPKPEFWQDLVGKYLDRYQGTYPGRPVPMLLMIHSVMAMSGVSPEQYLTWEESLRDFLRSPNAGFTLLKGRNGGITRSGDITKMITNFVKEIPTIPDPVVVMSAKDRWLPGPEMSYQDLLKLAKLEDKPVASTDNYTCKRCGCSKLCTATDKSCWSCGEPVKVRTTVCTWHRL